MARVPLELVVPWTAVWQAGSVHVPPAGWIFGGQSGTPPPWPFLSSPPHLLMLEAGAFHRLLNPSPLPRGESHQLLACWSWFWRLGCLTSLSAALSLAHCLGSVSASTSPRRRRVQPDTVILRAETIALYFASLNDHKDQFLGKRRRLCGVRFSPFSCAISCAFAWHCVVQSWLIMSLSESCALPRGWRFWNLTDTIPGEQLKAAAYVSCSFEGPRAVSSDDLRSWTRFN